MAGEEGRTVAVVRHPDRDQAAALEGDIRRWLEDHGHRATAPLEAADLVVSIGGDGTMLRAVDQAAIGSLSTKDMLGGHAGCGRQHCGSYLALCCSCVAHAACSAARVLHSASTSATIAAERATQLRREKKLGGTGITLSQLSEVAVAGCERGGIGAFLRFCQLSA